MAQVACDRSVSRRTRLRRAAVSLFIALNLGVVVYLNLPEGVHHHWQKAADRAAASSVWAYRARYAEWLLRRYAYAVGLDNRWQMFGYQTRFNWWYVIRGEYGDAETTELVVLPLPNQSPRSFWQNRFFDMKEHKFALNIYRRQDARRAYSQYLARQFPTHEGQPIQAVRWELGYQPIHEPAEARRLQRLCEDRFFYQQLDRFETPAEHTTATSATSPGDVAIRNYAAAFSRHSR